MVSVAFFTELMVLEKTAEAQAFVKPMLFHKVGNGRRTYIWRDYWHPFGPLLHRFGYKVVYDSGIGLHSKLFAIIQNGCWMWPHVESNNLVEIHLALCESFLRSTTDDEIVRLPFKSHVFSLPATWNQIRVCFPKVLWYKLVWFKGSIPKHSFFAWLAMLDELATRIRIHKWMPNLRTACLICGVDESRDHLFFSCPYASMVWTSITSLKNLLVPQVVGPLLLIGDVLC